MQSGGIRVVSIRQYSGIPLHQHISIFHLTYSSNLDTGLNVPFLNYVSNIRARIGQGMTIRVGGNSQENMELFFTPFDDYEIINKTLENSATDPVCPFYCIFFLICKC